MFEPYAATMKKNSRVRQGALWLLVGTLIWVGAPTSANAVPLAAKVKASSSFVVYLNPDGETTVSITAGSYSGSEYGKGAEYSGKCVVKILDRNGHRVLLNRKLPAGRTDVTAKKAKVKKGRLDIDIRVSCAKKTVVVKDDGDPYRVVFTKSSGAVENVQSYGPVYSYFG